MSRRRTASLCSSLTFGMVALSFEGDLGHDHVFGQKSLEGGAIPQQRRVWKEQLAVALEVDELLAEEEHAAIEAGLTSAGVSLVAAEPSLGAPQLDGALL